MLDPRLRQLHDEPRSGGNQSAHQRMINRRFNDRASCFAQRRLYCEGNAKKGGEDFLRLLLETANISLTLAILEKRSSGQLNTTSSKTPVSSAAR